MAKRILTTDDDVAAFDAEQQRFLHDCRLVSWSGDERELVFPIPTDATVIEIASAYSEGDGEGNPVRCAACVQHQRHKRGFIAQLADGGLARIGHDCGQRHFGAGAWQAALKGYDNRKRTAFYLHRLEPAINSLDKIKPILQLWHDTSKRETASFIEKLKKSPSLWSAIQDCCRVDGGAFKIEKWKQVDEVDRNGQKFKKKVIIEEIISRIPFPDIFSGGGANSLISGAKDHIALAVALLQIENSLVQHARAFKHLAEAKELITDAAERYDKFILNLDNSWLRPVVARRDAFFFDIDFEQDVSGQIVVLDGHRSYSIDLKPEATVAKAPVREILALWP